MVSIEKIFEKNYGYVSLKELKQKGIHSYVIRRKLKAGVIEKVKPGLYKRVDMSISAQRGMIEVCAAMPRAVICLHSALAYYEMTTTVPGNIMIALPRDVKSVKIPYPPIRVFHFSERLYSTGIKRIETESGIFRIYDIEKTIIDCFRFRKKLGEDIALEGLKNYLSTSKYQITKIVKYAKAGRIFSVMKPYLEAYLQR